MQSLAQTVDQETGEQKINLAIPPFKIARNARLLNIHYVKQDEVMRPDLISTIKLGNQNRMGSLLKFNGISNPFSIYEGQILAVPTQQTVNDIFNSKKIKNQASSSSNTNTNPLQSFRKNQEQKKFQISPGRKQFLDDKIKNKPNMTLPPNVAQPGTSQVIKENGFVIFAPNSGGGGTNIPTNS